MLKLRYEWGKAYEYLSEFNRLIRLSVREVFYDLAAKKQTLVDYFTCLKRCDTFSEDYKDEYLERYEYNRERKIAIMALLGMMDPRRPSKDIEAKRRRNRDNCRGNIRDFIRRESTKQNNYDNNHNGGKDVDTRPSERQNYYKDFRTSSNNSIPKSVLLMQDGSEYEEFVPEAKISNLRTKERFQDLNLAKEMGIKREERSLIFTTATGKVLIPQETEEFQIKVRLVEELTGKVKWYDFTSTLDNNYIGMIDVHDKQPKVYKIDGERPGLPDKISKNNLDTHNEYPSPIMIITDITVKLQRRPSTRPYTILLGVNYKKVLTVQEKKNYKLDISRSPFPNIYPVFHVSKLEPYYKIPKTLVQALTDNLKVPFKLFVIVKTKLTIFASSLTTVSKSVILTMINASWV
ncbi:hypothetical protein H8356DRAFT_1377622 [Neocallimastix lanati (nom. inval.)]|nr:hypothetical protein H8356DRAFT_1377622 [Neocallimastix sp. JGI-2020a]